jgi:hypothetical protein
VNCNSRALRISRISSGRSSFDVSWDRHPSKQHRRLRRAGDEIYTAVLPPSTGRIAPWTKLARSVARNTIASAISSGAAGRPAGACAASCCSASPIAAVPSVRVGPGLTAFTRTPLGPYSAAHALVSSMR